MAKNYVLLETVTVGAAGASSITFNSIPQTGYTDLKLVISGRTTGTNQTGIITLNTDTTDANYTQKVMVGTGAATGSSQGNVRYFFYVSQSTDTANTFSSVEMYYPNYTSATAKAFSVDSTTENNGTTAYANFVSGLWSGTAAINKITFSLYSGNFAAGSTFSLYGLAAVGTTPTVAPKASGGDIIQTDGTYWYHTFLYSGTFTPQKSLACDYLVVAGGGGGGGGRSGGGGGAGGYRTSTATFASAQTVTIGAGGTGGAQWTDGTNGTNSSLGSISSTGGGFGKGSTATTSAGSGGSGGGANEAGITRIGLGNAGSYSPVEGYNGGYGQPNTIDTGGGGGGAGAVGGNSVANTRGGLGGNGATTSISGSSVTYAGGGGGASDDNTVVATGGTGGGGNGGTSTTAPTAGTANLGGGGGASGVSTWSGASGGSGVVIIRYLVTA